MFAVLPFCMQFFMVNLKTIHQISDVANLLLVTADVLRLPKASISKTLTSANAYLTRLFGKFGFAMSDWV